MAQAVDVLVRGETSVTLTEYIIVFGCANLILAQCPHFHAIRYINAVATVCTISFSIIAVAMSIYDGAFVCTETAVQGYHLRGSSVPITCHSVRAGLVLCGLRCLYLGIHCDGVGVD